MSKGLKLELEVIDWDKCPECGSVCDSDSPVCDVCGFDFVNVCVDDILTCANYRFISIDWVKKEAV